MFNRVPAQIDVIGGVTRITCYVSRVDPYLYQVIFMCGESTSTDVGRYLSEISDQGKVVLS